MVVYDAFISYNHAKDRMVATRLQRLMQRLGKPWYVRRAMRVFRDDTSLSATPHLWPSIEAALNASRYLVLIASPEAAASRWVFQETQYWLEHKSADTLLLALTAGELTWDIAANDFVCTENTPLPRSLKGRFTHEPKWIDLRAFRNATHGSAEELLAAADLAATVRGIPKEDLLSEEVRQHRSAMMLSAAAAACLFCLSVVAGWQWREAVAQRNRAEINLLDMTQSANDLVVKVATQMRQTLGIPTAIVDGFLKKVADLQGQLVKTNASSVNLRRAQAITLRAQSQALLGEGDYTGALDKARQSTNVLNTLLATVGDDPGLEYEMSHSLDREGEAAAKLKQHDKAREAFQRALTIRMLLPRPPPNDAAQVQARQRDIAVTLERVGDETFELGNYDETADRYQDSLKIRQALDNAKPDDPDTREDLAAGYDRIAKLHQKLGAAEAIEEFKQSIDIREKLVRLNPLNADWQDGLATDYAMVGYLLISRGDCSNAVKPLQQALDKRQDLVARAPDRPAWGVNLAAILYYLATCNDQKQQRLQQALDIISKLQSDGRSPPNADALRAVVQSQLSASPR